MFKLEIGGRVDDMINLDVEGRRSMIRSSILAV